MNLTYTIPTVVSPTTTSGQNEIQTVQNEQYTHYAREGEEFFELVPGDDPILTEVMPAYKDPSYDNTVKLSKKLVATMYHYGGIGLAANQVGVRARIIAIRAAPENIVLINPKIVDTSDKFRVMEEGCLSFPGLFVKIKRPTEIKVRFQVPNGEIMTKHYVGMTARIIQHEIDHLDGVLFYNLANRYHRDLAFKNMSKLKRGKR